MYYITCYNSAFYQGGVAEEKGNDTRRQSVLPVTICMAVLKLFASFHLPILFLLLTSFYSRHVGYWMPLDIIMGFIVTSGSTAA
ncbi:hypothetical protein HDV57DRAFT_43584 [Trichoderma longibrachiatum]